MLSVPVPSDMVMSPFAMPWFMSSSIMNDVSPFTFSFLVVPSFLEVLVGDIMAEVLLPRVDFLPSLVGDPARTPFFGPFSLF